MAGVISALRDDGVTKPSPLQWFQKYIDWSVSPYTFDNEDIAYLDRHFPPPEVFQDRKFNNDKPDGYFTESQIIEIYRFSDTKWQANWDTGLIGYLYSENYDEANKKINNFGDGTFHRVFFNYYMIWVYRNQITPGGIDSAQKIESTKRRNRAERQMIAHIQEASPALFPGGAAGIGSEGFSYLNFQKKVAELVNDRLLKPDPKNLDPTSPAYFKVTKDYLFVKKEIIYGGSIVYTLAKEGDSSYKLLHEKGPLKGKEYLLRVPEEVIRQTMLRESPIYREPVKRGILNEIRLKDDLESAGYPVQGEYFDVRREYFFVIANAYVKNVPLSDYQGIQNTFLEKAKAASERVAVKFALKTVNEIRKRAFIDLVETAMLRDLTIEDIKKAFEDAEEVLKGDEEITGKDFDAEQLSEDQIQQRQKFLKQCLLMTRLDTLQNEHKVKILKKQQSKHVSTPYESRLFMLDDPKEDRSSIVNKLLIPRKDAIQGFLDITPAQHASLVPKLRFYKVFTKMVEGNPVVVDHEFTFPQFTNKTRVDNLKNDVFDKGDGFGVKEFTFSFEGTSPATARNDIKATLKLFFQSFSDFIKDRNGHKYVDLLLLPGGQPKVGSGESMLYQYDPSYYRIRVDVGWVLESAPTAEIKKALKKINKSFYLNMIDHEMQFNDDGSVEIGVTYRAYAESALKSTTLDALASPESRAALKQVRDDYKIVVDKESCSTEELAIVRSQFLEIEERLKNKHSNH